MRGYVVILLTILAMAGSFSVLAQANLTVRVDVPFSFIAGTKTLPAGEYTLQFADNEKEMIVRGSKASEGVFVPILTRLGQRSEKEAEVVFDVAGNEHYLAEVHIPTIDGVAFKAAPGKHTHVSVKAKK